MRYDDQVLWDISKTNLDVLKKELSFNQFCIWSIGRLQRLVRDSLNGDWMMPDKNHLRNYRIKAIGFYEKKLVRK
jgi:hypothetical protein